MDRKYIVKELNKMLAQEHACAIRYATHAAVISGPYSEVISARLKEICSDEVLHAAMLRERILSLKGTISMDVSIKDLVSAKTLADILSINIAEEKDAILSYTSLLEHIPDTNIILYRTIQDIIRDEQEHLEELENFL